VTNSELGSSGEVGAALAMLNAQNTSLAAQQAALNKLEQAMAAINAVDPFTVTDPSSQSSATSGLFGSGLSAYQSNMNGF
jgi:hypothetical protein